MPISAEHPLGKGLDCTEAQNTSKEQADHARGVRLNARGGRKAHAPAGASRPCPKAG